MGKIDLVIFDFDGVLADSASDIASAIRASQAHFGYPIMEADDIVNAVGFGAKKLVEDTMPGAGKAVLDWYMEYYEEHPAVETVLYPGVRKLLEYLKNKGIIACVLSNKQEALVKKILKILAVDSCFSTVLGPESLSKMKPDPEGIIYCLDKYKIEPYRCLMVGDSYSDIRAGKSAKVNTCALLYGYGDREKLFEEKADFYTQDINCIIDYFDI